MVKRRSRLDGVAICESKTESKKREDENALCVFPREFAFWSQIWVQKISTTLEPHAFCAPLWGIMHSAFFRQKKIKYQRKSEQKTVPKKRPILGYFLGPWPPREHFGKVHFEVVSWPHFYSFCCTPFGRSLCGLTGGIGGSKHHFVIIKLPFPRRGWNTKKPDLANPESNLGGPLGPVLAPRTENNFTRAKTTETKNYIFQLFCQNRKKKAFSAMSFSSTNPPEKGKVRRSCFVKNLRD